MLRPAPTEITEVINPIISTLVIVFTLYRSWRWAQRSAQRRQRVRLILASALFLFAALLAAVQIDEWVLLLLRE